ncbi:TIGR04255 family protein [Massilia sp. CFBP9026]|uniref:TIGR04255 family protein n=1 Tax=Massilia sp. CFBP9026 TaxID=3096536 RepID=UPI002A6A0030|nr:TIGR04255 family protein [Massilia sp. CFBP9026]MDY0961778.1 TIGR04255 family protein [Massilia sp. CFBP9026]
MSSPATADQLVKVQSSNIERYKRNFLKQAVCELRFPTLMELGESKPPAAVVHALRKEYPILELANEVTFGVGMSNESNHIHTLRSSKMNWSVSIKQSALTIETTSYSEYTEMKARVLRVVQAAEKSIDTDFFTRIGLRYINVIDVGSDPSDGWINPSLVSPIREGAFINIQEFAGKLLLSAQDGGCLLQHGIRLKPAVNDAEVVPEYFIDIDSFRSEVPLNEVASALDSMHAQAFNLFDWCLGEKSREYLANPRNAKKREGE